MVLLGLARALLATTMLVVQTVPHVLKATAVMPPGVSLIVYLVPILLMTVQLESQEDFTA